MIDLKLKTDYCQFCLANNIKNCKSGTGRLSALKDKITHSFYVNGEYQNYDYFNHKNKIFLSYFFDFDIHKSSFFFVAEPFSSNVLFKIVYYNYDHDLKFNSFKNFEKFVIDLYNKYLENSIFE